MIIVAIYSQGSSPVLQSDFSGELAPSIIEFEFIATSSGWHTVVVAPVGTDGICESINPPGAVWSRQNLEGGIRSIEVDCGGLAGECRWWAFMEPVGGGPPYNISDSCRNISFCTPPGAPELVSPFNGQDFNLIPLNLIFDEVDGADYYIIKISGDSWFTDYDTVHSISSPVELSADLWHGMGSPERVYWRVAAVNYSCGEGEFSAANYFNVNISGTVAAPGIWYPYNHSYICDLTPRFRWYSVSGADYYMLEVDNEADFLSPEYYRDDLTGTLHDCSISMDHGNYYWRMSSHNSEGWSEPSTVRDFTLGPTFVRVNDPPDIAVGSTFNITWSRCGGFHVDIFYSTDSGSSWRLIAEDESNDGSYEWAPVPNTPSATCLIKIQSIYDADPADISEPFAIYFEEAFGEFAEIYSPILRFHSDEVFFPMHAGILWDNCSIETERGRSFLLCDYGEDAAAAGALQALDSLACVYYRCGEEAGDSWIQYWLYYPFAFYNGSDFDHFSDWEVIGYLWHGISIDALSESPRVPDEITLSEHYFKVTDELTTSYDGFHPIIYIAEGTHAMSFQPLDGDTAIYWTRYLKNDLPVRAGEFTAKLAMRYIALCAAGSIRPDEVCSILEASISAFIVSWQDEFNVLGTIGDYLTSGLADGGILQKGCSGLENMIVKINDLLYAIAFDEFDSSGLELRHDSETDRFRLAYYPAQDWSDFYGFWGRPENPLRFPIGSPETPFYMGDIFDNPVEWITDFPDEVAPYILITDGTVGDWDYDIEIQDFYGRVCGVSVTDSLWNMLPGAVSYQNRILLTDYALRMAVENRLIIRLIGIGGSATSIQISNSLGDTIAFSGVSAIDEISFNRLDTDYSGASFSLTEMPELNGDVINPTIAIFPADGDTISTLADFYIDLHDTLSRLDMHTCFFSFDSIFRPFYHDFPDYSLEPAVGSPDVGWHTVEVFIDDLNFNANTSYSTFYYDTVPPPVCDGLFDLVVGGAFSDSIYDIVENVDSGFTYCGITNSWGEGNSDLFMIKTNPDFEPIWSKTYGTSANEFGKVDMITVDGGGYYVILTTDIEDSGYGDIIIMKLNPYGWLEWSRQVGNVGSLEKAVGIAQSTTSGTLAFVGNTQISGDDYILTGLISSSGSISSLRYIDYTGQTAEDFSSSNDGGFILTGYTEWLDGDLLIINFDEILEINWMRAIGSTGEAHGYSAIATEDGGYGIIGYIEEYGAGGRDQIIIKLDNGGFAEWYKAIGTSADEEGLGIDETRDRGFVVNGSITGRFDRDGNLLWARSDSGCKIITTGDRQIVSIADYSSFFGSNDMQIMRIDSSGWGCDGDFAFPTVSSFVPDFNFRLLFYDDLPLSVSPASIETESFIGNFEYLCSCDTTAPSISITCPTETLTVDEEYTFSFTITDDFISSAPCSVIITGCGLDVRDTTTGGSYTWYPTAPCGSALIQIKARDVFHNFSSSYCTFVIRDRCTAVIDSIWAIEETFCDDINSIEICYEILSTCAGSTYVVEASLYPDTLAEWMVPLETRTDDAGDIGAGISGEIEHCFNWILSDDWYNAEGDGFVLTMESFDEGISLSSDTSLILLDSKPPEIIISGSWRVYVYVGNNQRISWSKSEMFPSSANDIVHVWSCAGDTTIEISPSTRSFDWRMSVPEGVCDTVFVEIASIDSFCNYGADTVKLIPRSSISVTPRIITDGLITSCHDQNFRWRYSAHCVIDTLTARIVINGDDEYYLASEFFTCDDTCFYFQPDGDFWLEGEHNIQLNLEDNCDNSYSRTWNVIFDYTPPLFLGFSPIGIADTSIGWIEIIVRDAVTNISDIAISSNSSCEGINLDMEDLSINGDTIRFPFVECEDYIEICVEVADNPDICEPNRDSLCFEYLIEGIIESVELSEPMDIFGDGLIVSACSLQEISWIIEHNQRLDLSTILVSVDSIEYRYPENLVFSSDTVYFLPDTPFTDMSEIEICFEYVRDISGIGLAEPACESIFIRRSVPEPFSILPVPGSVVYDSIVTIAVEMPDLICDSYYSYAWVNSSISSGSWDTDSLEFVINGLVDGDSISIDFMIWDECADYCYPISDTFHYYFYVSIGAPSGVVLEPYEELDEIAVSSCLYQPLSFILSCPDGMDDEATVRVCIEEIGDCVRNPGLDIHKNAVGDSMWVSFYPDSIGYDWSEFDGDTVHFYLDSAFSLPGYPLSHPIRGSFIPDFSPPIFSDIFPLDGFRLFSDSITIEYGIYDSVCGVTDADSLIVSISPYHSGWSFDFATGKLEGLEDGDHVDLCLYASDDCIDYCDANDTLFCWGFDIAMGDISVSINLPEDLNDDGIILTDCLNLPIRWIIYHSEPLDLASIRLSVDGIGYVYSDDEVSLEGDSLIFEPSDAYASEIVEFCIDSIADITGAAIGASVCSDLTIFASPPVIEIGTGPVDGDDIYGDIITGSFIADDSICSSLGIDSIHIVTNLSGISESFLSNEYDISGLIDRDSVRICAYSNDNCRDYSCVDSIGILCIDLTVSIGGISAEILEPIDITGSTEIITSCPDQGITWLINHDYDLIESSIIAEINGVEYTMESPYLELSGDSLVFIPDAAIYMVDRVEFCLMIVADETGESLSAPVCGEFIIDTLAPMFESTYPIDGGVIFDDEVLIDAIFTDSPCLGDISIDNIWIDVYDASGALRSSAFDSEFPVFIDGLLDGDSISVNAVVCDNCIDYCSSNCDTLQFHFGVIMGTSHAEMVLPNDVNGDDRIISNCEGQGFVIKVSDTLGPIIEGIHFSVDGIELDEGDIDLVWYESPDSSVMFIRWLPEFPYDASGWIEVVLDSLFNRVGSNLSERLLDSFFIDIDGPLVSIDIPTGFHYDDSVHIEVEVFDSVCGDACVIDSCSVSISGVYRDSSFVLYDSDFDILMMEDEDSISICVYASDDCADTCDANSTYTCESFIVALGAIFAETIEPVDVNLDGRIVSNCNDQRFAWLVHSGYGLDPYSITMRICDAEYAWGSSMISFMGDTIVWQPSPGFFEASDSCSFCLNGLCDTIGNCLIDSICGIIQFDLSEPVVISESPSSGEIIASMDILIDADIIDSLCGEAHYDSVEIIGYRDDIIQFSVSPDSLPYLLEGLARADSVSICIWASDSCGDYCRNNSIEDCWAFLVDISGPSAEVIYPEEGIITSCNDSAIIWILSGEPVDSSITVDVDGISFDLESPALYRIDDNLIFRPDLPFDNNASVHACIVRMYDEFANPLTDSVCVNFTIDIEAPIIFDLEPSPVSFITESMPEISVSIFDSISGVNFDYVYLTISDIEAGFSYDSMSIRHNSSIFDDGDSIICCIEAQDMARECGVNVSDTCWMFHIRTEGPEIIALEPSGYTSCRNQGAIFEIIDDDGISSVTVTLNSMFLSDDWLDFDGESLEISPPDEANYYQNADSITICVSAIDPFGNLSDTVCINFIVDIMPPTILGISPAVNDSVDNILPSFEIGIIDSLSGIDDESIELLLNDEITEFTYEGNFIQFVSDTDFVQNRWNTFCLSAGDNAAYCGANEFEQCWDVFHQGFADLYFDSLQFIPSSEITEGDSVVFRGFMANNLYRDADLFSLCVELDGRVIYTFDNISITAGCFEMFEIPLYLPDGDYELCMNADCGLEIIESDEDNNLSCMTLIVRASECDAYPNPFSPNDDGFYDFAEFQYPGQGDDLAEVHIYDLENRLVRRLAGNRRWDGADNGGNPMPRGAYVFIVIRDGKIICDGNIYLMR